MRTPFLRYCLVVLMCLLVGTSSAIAKKSISIMHIWTGMRERLVQEVIAQFEQMYPDIEVESILVASPAELQEKAMLGFVSGTGPDIIMANPAWARAWAAEGAAVPLDQFMKAEGLILEDYIYESVIPDTQYGGNTYFLPHIGGVQDYLLYWNVHDFESSGLDADLVLSDLEELRTGAMKLAQFGSDGILLRAGLDVGASTHTFESWLLLNGGHGLGEFQDGQYVYTFADELGQYTLNWMLEFHESVSGGYPNLQRYYVAGARNPEQAFINGQASMLLGGDWFFSMLWDEGLESFKDFRVGLRPAAPGLERQYRGTTGWGYIISVNSPNQAEAWEFLKYFTLQDGAAHFMISQARPSVLKAVNQSLEYFDANPFWPVVMSAFQYARHMPLPPVTVSDQPLASAIAKVLAGESNVSSALEEAARLMQTDLNRALGQ